MQIHAAIECCIFFQDFLSKYLWDHMLFFFRNKKKIQAYSEYLDFKSETGR